MATIFIDGQAHTLLDGGPWNVIQAALRASVEIPYFCWHPALSVVANCRSHKAFGEGEGGYDGPHRLRSESERFAQAARGEMVWFNVCFLMFKPQELFDVLLRPALENPRVTAIQFIADEGERQLWELDVLPKIKQCSGQEKVKEPRWSKLPETVSFILADTEPKGSPEALLSFWGEPFMARTTGKNVPRYIFWIQSHSELVSRLSELARHVRIRG